MGCARFGVVLAYVGTALILGMTVAWIVLRVRRGLVDVRIDFALLSAIVVLITPVVWFHYYVLLLPTFLALFKPAHTSQRIRWLVLVGYFLFVLDFYWRQIVLLVPSPLVLGFNFYGSLCIWIALLIVASPFQSRATMPASAPAPPAQAEPERAG
ncbi:MAG: hypothetical protein HC876_20365 [Chloroflexaceae bacterium]|nr:hypothetical protein [Chloroflexaceae bacterium]NJO07679.1 hypothetical protein [Chloroflexaceae bacterium]